MKHFEKNFDQKNPKSRRRIIIQFLVVLLI